jgi:hypothetical protein
MEFSMVKAPPEVAGEILAPFCEFAGIAINLHPNLIVDLNVCLVYHIGDKEFNDAHGPPFVLAALYSSVNSVTEQADIDMANTELDAIPVLAKEVDQ